MLWKCSVKSYLLKCGEQIASDCQSDVLCFSFSAQLSSKCQCCCPRPLLPRVPSPPLLKDTLCEVHHILLLLLFVGVLSRLQGGKDVLVTKFNWMGWLYRQFLFLFTLQACFVTHSILLIAVVCCIFLWKDCLSCLISQGHPKFNLV